MQERRYTEVDVFCEARRPNREFYYFTGGSRDVFHYEKYTLKGKPASSANVVMTHCRPGLTVGKGVIELAC